MVVADDAWQARQYPNVCVRVTWCQLATGTVSLPVCTRLLRDEDLLSRLGRRARQSVMEDFAWHMPATVLERAYAG